MRTGRRRLSPAERAPERPPGPQLPPRRITPVAQLSHPKVEPAQYFSVRVVRDGPLVPARLWWCDHEPGCPENKLDRGMLSVFPRADIAGTEVVPEQLIERTWPAPTHWKWAHPIAETEYRRQLAWLRWAEDNRPEAPVLTPRKAVDREQLGINFDRENAL